MTRYALLSSALVICLLAASLSAHEVTFKGTVVTAEPAAVKITVVDEKTKKPMTMAFDIDKETKILRGNAVVTFAAARIQKGEKIAVTIDHDSDETLAVKIQLDEKK